MNKLYFDDNFQEDVTFLIEDFKQETHTIVIFHCSRYIRNNAGVLSTEIQRKLK